MLSTQSGVMATNSTIHNIYCFIKNRKNVLVSWLRVEKCKVEDNLLSTYV